MKKIVSIILLIALLAGLLPVITAAADEYATVSIIFDSAAIQRVTYNDEEYETEETIYSSTIIPWPVGTVMELERELIPGITFDGYYVDDNLMTTKKKASITVNGDMTIEVRHVASNDWTDLTYTGSAISDVQTREAYPWINTDGVFASGNQSTTAASVLKVKATQTGTLQFQYKTNTAEGKGWLLYKKGTELTRSNYNTADNYKKMADFAGKETGPGLRFPLLPVTSFIFFTIRVTATSPPRQFGCGTSATPAPAAILSARRRTAPVR